MRSVAHLGLPANLRGADKTNRRLWPVAHSSVGGRFVPREESSIQSGDDWWWRMRPRKRTGALLHAPIPANSVPSLGSRLPRVRRLAEKFTRSCQSDTFGPPELCAWRVVPGVFWIQTTEPIFSRRLTKRSDARRVEITGINHFRRTFEVHGTWRKVQRIINRYLVSTSGQFSRHIRPQEASEAGGSINTAGTRVAS